MLKCVVFVCDLQPAPNQICVLEVRDRCNGTRTTFEKHRCHHCCKSENKGHQNKKKGSLVALHNTASLKPRVHVGGGGGGVAVMTVIKYIKTTTGLENQ